MFGKIEKTGEIYIDGRISYPTLFEAKAVKNDPNARPRYGATCLLPKSDTGAKKLLDSEIQAQAKKHFKGKVPPGDKLFIYDGDGDYGDEHSKGCWIVRANRQESQGRPIVGDKNKQPLAASDNAILAGYKCRFLLSVYTQAKWGRICCGLNGVQLLSSDEEVIGANSQESFDALPDADPDAEDEGFDEEEDSDI